MHKFLFKCLIFSIPGIILLMPPILLLKYSRENYFDIDKLIKKNEKYLVGYVYNESNYKYLKWKEITSKPKQDVIALGSSRVLQFRDRMFESSFYNAGFTISSISDFVPFLKSIPKVNFPDILLISLDQWMFNENWDSLKEINSNTLRWKNSFNKNPSLNSLMNVWFDLLKGKFSITSLFRQSNNLNLKKVGLNSLANDMGFRSDGSFFDGKQIIKLLNSDSSARDYKYNDTYSRIKTKTRYFESGNQVNFKALKELESLLKFCSDNNIYIIAILPPFADKVNEQIRINGNYLYMNNIYNESIPIFEKYGFELWDMTALQKFNSDDNETIDGFHGSEVSYLKMLIYMLEHDSKLNKYTNIKRLNEDLNNRLNKYLVYSY